MSRLICFLSETSSNENLDHQLRGSLERELRNYYKSVGILTRKPPLGIGFGAGPGDLQIFLAIMSGVIRLLTLLTSKIARKHLRVVQPGYKIALLYDTSSTFYVENEEEVGNLVGQTLYYGWLGQQFLSRKYPGLQFPVWAHVRFNHYTYSVDYYFTSMRDGIADISQAIRIARGLRIRADTTDKLMFGESPFVTLERLRNTTRKIVFLKYDKIINTRPFFRGLRVSKMIKSVRALEKHN